MKMFIILLLIIAIIFIIIFLHPFIPTSQFNGSITDHFDGKIFYNPGHVSKKTILDLLKWRFSTGSKRWPSYVRNVPSQPIASVLNPPHIQTTFVNHATVLIQTSTLNILTDPIWSYRASPFKGFGPARVRDPGIPFSKLPHIDVVLISHNHYDHLDIPTLQKLHEKFKPIFLVPLGDKLLLEKSHITNVFELDWWQAYSFKNATMTFLPTQHWSARWLTDKFATLWGSYGIRIGNTRIYFAGDSGYSANFKKIRDQWGAPDLAFLPIGSYLPEWFMQENHMNPEEAVRAHLDLGSEQSVAIHYGTFKLSDEAIDQPIIDLHEALKRHALASDKFIILPEGRSLTIK